jgi:hypothetical protein
LHEALTAVPDARSRFGNYYSLLALLSLVAGAVFAGLVTGDAMFCHRDFCEKCSTGEDVWKND